MLRRYVITTAGIAAAATGALFYAAHVVQRELDRAGLPGCLDPNVCYPHGSAMRAVQGMELVAAFVPALIGLILGFGVLTGALKGERVTKLFGWALLAGLICAAAVALAYRLVDARYTILANDTYELLEMLHLNNVAFMLAQTALLTAVIPALGLPTGRRVLAGVLAVVVWPLGIMCAFAGVSLLSYPLVALFGSVSREPSGRFTDDITMADPLAYAATGVLAIMVALLVLLVRRTARRRADGGTADGTEGGTEAALGSR
jgi:hypothetical protein